MVGSVASTKVSSRSKDRKKLLKGDILSKEEEARMMKEKKDRMDSVKRQYSRRKLVQRSSSRGRPSDAASSVSNSDIRKRS